MTLKEAVETRMAIIPYRYNVASKDLEESEKILKEAAHDGTLMVLIERDEGAEPILESRVSTYHESRADGTGGFTTKEYEDWVCPKCGWLVGELYSGHGMWHVQGESSFCARCGQRIDWSKPKDEEKQRYEERKRLEREKWEREHGNRLDNMNERRRRKYGMMEER